MAASAVAARKRSIVPASAAAAASQGPSSFPRRQPQAQFATSSKIQASGSQQTNNPEIQDSMARRLTRFYTANFDKRPVMTLCITNCILSGFGDACAQLLPMVLEGTSNGWDFQRTLRFTTYGFALGPLIEKWNRFLEYRFPLRPISQVFETPSVHDDGPEWASKLKREAEKEGFRVNMEKGDALQGQQFASKGKHIVDPQTVAMPNVGQPGQVSVVALFKRVLVDQLFMAPLGLILFLTSMGLLEGLEWSGIAERFRRLYWVLLIANWQIWPFVQLINFRYLPLRYRVPFSASLGVLWTIFLSFKNAKASAPA